MCTNTAARSEIKINKNKIEKNLQKIVCFTEILHHSIRSSPQIAPAGSKFVVLFYSKVQKFSLGANVGHLQLREIWEKDVTLE